MCAVLNISPKTYYKYRNKEDPDYYDYLIIKEIFDDSKGTYGYRRIVEGLKIKYGVVMNGKKVLRIMKKYNLMAEYIRKSKKKNKNERIEKLEKSGYRFVGTHGHAAVKTCHWTRQSISDKGVCYKEKFYGIKFTIFI